MSGVAERILDYLGRTERPAITILLIDASSVGDEHWYWVATDGYEKVDQGGPHPTKRDSLEEAHDRCPRWAAMRTL